MRFVLDDFYCAANSRSAGSPAAGMAAAGPAAAGVLVAGAQASGTHRSSFRAALVCSALLLATAVLAGCASATDGSAVLGAQDPEARLTEIFTVLDELVLTADTRNEVRQIYTGVREAIQSGQISVVLGSADEFADASILQSVYFTTDDEMAAQGRGIIVVNPEILFHKDKVAENGDAASSGNGATATQPVSSLTLSLLMETVGYSSIFLQQGPAFLAGMNDPVVRYLTSMDALFLQARFVQLFLAGNYKLSPYDTYLVETLQVDSLSSVSMYFRGVDQDLVVAIIQQTEAVRSGDLELPTYLSQVAELVSLLGERYNAAFGSEPGTDGLDERVRYITTVTVGSYLKFGVQVINELLSELQPEITASAALTASVRSINQNSRTLFQAFQASAWDLQPFRAKFQSEFF